MAVTPLPVIIPLSRVGVVPIDVVTAMMLLPVHMVRPFFVIGPLMIVLVVRVVVTVFTLMIAAVIVVRGLR
jgi:hypothetical protein